MSHVPGRQLMATHTADIPPVLAFPVQSGCCGGCCYGDSFWLLSKSFLCDDLGSVTSEVPCITQSNVTLLEFGGKSEENIFECLREDPTHSAFGQSSTLTGALFSTRIGGFCALSLRLALVWDLERNNCTEAIRGWKVQGCMVG